MTPLEAPIVEATDLYWRFPEPGEPNLLTMVGNGRRLLGPDMSRWPGTILVLGPSTVLPVPFHFDADAYVDRNRIRIYRPSTTVWKHMAILTDIRVVMIAPATN